MRNMNSIVESFEKNNVNLYQKKIEGVSLSGKIDHFVMETVKIHTVFS